MTTDISEIAVRIRRQLENYCTVVLNEHDALAILAQAERAVVTEAPAAPRQDEAVVWQFMYEGWSPSKDFSLSPPTANTRAWRPLYAHPPAASAAAARIAELEAERVELMSDMNDLDAVVRVLGLESSHVTPADAIEALQADLDAAHLKLSALSQAERAEPRPAVEWHEGVGDVLWWCFPIDEPPYVGSPLDTDWPGYHTHWTLPRLPSPPPALAAPEVQS